MSPNAPPPLPDVFPPLARQAVGDAWVFQVPGRVDEARPVARFTRLCLYAPLPVALPAAALMLLKEYASGADFRHDSTHALVRIFDVVVFCAAAGVPLVVAGIIFLCTWRRLEGGARRTAGAGAALAGMTGVLSVVLCEGVFQWGKARAYAAVNATALAADCAAVSAAPRARPSASGESTYEARDPIVPAYTRSTGAKWVRVTPAGVFVVMSTDLFAGVREEGFFVPAAPQAGAAGAYSAAAGMTVLSTRPLVYRYAR